MSGKATHTGSDLAESRRLIAESLELIDSLKNLEGDKAVIAARSAAWRLADGAALFREAMEYEGIEASGVTKRTGRGVYLPNVKRCPWCHFRLDQPSPRCTEPVLHEK